LKPFPEEIKISEIRLRDTFGDFLIDNASIYEKMVVLDGDLSSSTRTNKFAIKFPKRFFNFGIAEQNMVGAAMGFAISGKIPIVSGFTLFTTGRAWEFIRMTCHDNLNVKFITTHAGFVGEDGSSHNAFEDLSIMATLPNIHILVPADNIELESMLKFALNTNGPFYLRLPRGSFPNIHERDYEYSKEKIDVIKNGTDLCIIGIGYGTSLAREYLSRLEDEFDISIKLINLSTIKPFPKEMLNKELKLVNKLLVIEEHNVFCGVSSMVARNISEEDPKSIKSIGIVETYGESGKRDLLLEKYGFNLRTIEKKVKSLLKYE